MKTLPEIIYAAMKRYSEYTAIKIKDKIVSYEELNQSALSIAAYLHSKDIVGKNIGILGQNDLAQYSGILGTIYAGCTYVPINMKYPASRINDIIEKANIRVLIGTAHEWESVKDILLNSGRIEHLVLPTGGGIKEDKINVVKRAELACMDQLDKPVESSPGRCIYIMFTSGSTGVPKGVQVTDSNLSSFINNMSAFYNLEAGFISAQTCDLSFDFSVFQVFFPWMHGGTICVLPQEELLCASEYIKREKITFWSSVPTLGEFMNKLGALLPGEFPDLVYSLFCGEPLTQSVANAWRRAACNSIVENFYGPTEATVFISRYVYTQKDEEKRYHNGIVPIGSPFEGQKIALVTDDNRIISDSEIGEIAICGSQVSRGYLNDDEKTNKVYVKMPWDEEKKLWYKTGDLAVYNDSGELEYVSRKDNQIKIGGRRIELGEIEAQLKENGIGHELIVVPFRNDNRVTQYLVAFATDQLSPDKIRNIKMSCEGLLEDIFFPKKFFYIEKIPTTVNGKIDRVMLEQKTQEYLKGESSPPDF